MSNNRFISSTTRSSNIYNFKEGIDYTFNTHRKKATEYCVQIPKTTTNKQTIYKSKLITEKPTNIKEYISDLTKTWQLNIDLISNILKNSPEFVKSNKNNNNNNNNLNESRIKIDNKSLNDNINNNNSNLFLKKPNIRLGMLNQNNINTTELLLKIQKIKELFENKKLLYKSCFDNRARLLIAMQIQEEQKNISKENLSSIEDEYKINLETLEKKESVLSQNEKKFDEVEIYVQRESQEDKQFNHYKDYKIINFLKSNQDMSYQLYLHKNFKMLLDIFISEFNNMFKEDVSDLNNTLTCILNISKMDNINNNNRLFTESNVRPNFGNLLNINNYNINNTDNFNYSKFGIDINKVKNLINFNIFFVMLSSNIQYIQHLIYNKRELYVLLEEKLNKLNILNNDILNFIKSSCRYNESDKQHVNLIKKNKIDYNNSDLNEDPQIDVAKSNLDLKKENKSKLSVNIITKKENHLDICNIEYDNICKKNNSIITLNENIEKLKKLINHQTINKFEIIKDYYSNNSKLMNSTLPDINDTINYINLLKDKNSIIKSSNCCRLLYTNSIKVNNDLCITNNSDSKNVCNNSINMNISFLNDSTINKNTDDTYHDKWDLSIIHTN